MDVMQIQRLIAVRNAAMREEFVKTVAKANWRLLKQTDTVDPLRSNHLIVIGLAVWSHPDLRTLDKLADKLGTKSVTVFVFDIDEFGFSDGMKTFIPGVDMPAKTPVIAEYIGGTLTQSCSGNAAFQWIETL